MADYLDFSGPAELRTRGTVLVVPGRGESPAGYVRFGRRLAADSYRVRVLPAPVLDESDLAGCLARFAATLSDAVSDVGDDGPVRPLVLAGADTGAAALASLVSRSTPAAGWWPAAVVLAALPGYATHQGRGWDEELDMRTHCPVHRGVLAADPSARPGSFAEAVPTTLLDAAYGNDAAIPHLLLVGDMDPFADREALSRLAKSLPSARLSVIRGAHHDVLNDLQHRSVAAAIVSFLEMLRNGPSLEPIVEVESSTW
jgi:alpha-beta hydrolase superfamily lysophospholipase